MVDAATEALQAVLGSAIRQQITSTVASNWTSEPYIRGAYAAASPGGADRRRDLVAPIEDRLFFAGEATSPQFSRRRTAPGRRAWLRPRRSQPRCTRGSEAGHYREASDISHKSDSRNPWYLA